MYASDFPNGESPCIKKTKQKLKNSRYFAWKTIYYTFSGGRLRLKAILIIFLGYSESQSYVSYFKEKKEIKIQ